MGQPTKLTQNAEDAIRLRASLENDGVPVKEACERAAERAGLSTRYVRYTVLRNEEAATLYETLKSPGAESPVSAAPLSGDDSIENGRERAPEAVETAPVPVSSPPQTEPELESPVEAESPTDDPPVDSEDDAVQMFAEILDHVEAQMHGAQGHWVPALDGMILDVRRESPVQLYVDVQKMDHTIETIDVLDQLEHDLLQRQNPQTP